MKQKTLELDCSQPLARQLARAVRAYAEAAFPPGGSECTQVSRQTLVESAVAIAEHGGGSLRIRKRQVVQLRAAVRWYFREIAPDEAAHGDTLLAILAKR